ncbi:MAG: response regulator [Proteobacteria bacterium]|nr:response regulator [Pseudomonadota bacterium]
MLATGQPLAEALDPTRMYLAAYGHVWHTPALALAATLVFVLVSQVKINVTNAYAGSLAWSNFFARLTHSHPGRVVWLVFNVLIALLLMTLGVFDALDTVLGLYSHVAAAWIGALVADLVVNKPLGLSPPGIEFKRAHLYDLNPVGLGAMALGTLAASVAFSGVLGPAAQAFAPFIALGLAFAAAPAIAWATRGRTYLARPPIRPAAPGRPVVCSVCENTYEAEDTAHCPAYGAPICSLCCTLDARCHDRCKRGSRADEQLQQVLRRLLPARLARRMHVRLGGFVLVFGALSLLAAAVLALVYLQEATGVGAAERLRLHDAFVKAGALLLLPLAVASWWLVLAGQTRRLAQQESDRQTERLTREIAAHQRTDAELQRAKEAAEAANRAKTRFVAGLSHELRTPLSAVLGYAELLGRDTSLPVPARQAVQTIAQSGEHLRGLVDELLDLARIEADRLPLAPAPLELAAFLRDLTRMVAPQAQALALTFSCVPHPGLPPRVRADAQRLRQVLLNLIGNALRFTPQGGAVRLEAAPGDAPGWLRFAVIDTGVGIAAADLPRLFEPFVRGATGPCRGEPGAGLGLAISDRLARAMGGSLHAHSQPGQGSRFTLALPLPALAPGEAQAPPPQRITGYAGPRRRLLVVDDHADQRTLLRAMLAPLGFAIDEAASGPAALRALAQGVATGLPDAVLLDIGMDGMDGWQTAQRIRAAGLTALPIVVVSAYLMEAQPEAPPVQAFVAKPVREAELLAALGRVLGLPWQ